MSHAELRRVDSVLPQALLITSAWRLSFCPARSVRRVSVSRCDGNRHDACPVIPPSHCKLSQNRQLRRTARRPELAFRRKRRACSCRFMARKTSGGGFVIDVTGCVAPVLVVVFTYDQEVQRNIKATEQTTQPDHFRVSVHRTVFHHRQVKIAVLGGSARRAGTE